MDRIKQGNQRTEELNIRISNRNIPSNRLQPQFGIRPNSTKYATMPIVDNRVKHTVDILPIPAYNISNTFNPGSATAPWSGFATNINNESRLRNQFFAIQNGAGQSCYIPSRNSDLYNKVTFPTTDDIQQTFPGLFEIPKFDNFNDCPKGVGDNFFENCTRQQIKDVV